MDSCLLVDIEFGCFYRDTIDAVKQSAALTLLRLLRASPDVIPMGEWTSRIIHLLNDQHMVSHLCSTCPVDALAVVFCCLWSEL